MIPSREDFSVMILKEQIKTLYEKGEFVVAIRYYDYKINLYLLGQFYVEVFFHHLHDRIEKIDILEGSPTRLKFYSDQIKLPANLHA